VQIQVRELGLTGDRPLTTSGGMSFAGGPLNNFVLQAMEPFVGALRAEPSSRGLLTAVSGMITKQGVSAWSCTPPGVPFAAGEVGATTAERTAVVDVDPVFLGRATVESWTVVHQGGAPWRAVALARTPTDRRAVVRCDDPEVVSSMVDDEWGGRDIGCRGEWFEA
jgi:acetyl-CoA C-acetyltransferase